MKAVLDSNVLLSALIVKVGKPAQIIHRIGRYELVTTEEILAETARALQRRHIRKRYPVTDEDVARCSKRLHAASTLIQPTITVAVVRKDPDDNKFFAMAKQVRADGIVSGDPDLTAIGEYEGIPVLTLAQFLERLQRREGR